ncbi:TauD/TfdA family dioxygenase [Azospirillum halopraeferens]|uniref:TauD/TfdA family dioxygenase n=1 Tax=Azospirillum halopraeferens TaxID=34010 RepID=UPI00041F659B|nr:TauD/TfdA family dioxygenase [Azospirillum halopraeferens]
MTAQTAGPPRGPFAPDDAAAYTRWRDAKLAHLPARPDDLLVELADPRAVTAAERAALAERCRRHNMALFVGPVVADGTRDWLRAFARTFGLDDLDSNMLADEDGISPLTVAADGPRRAYIPYTDRPLSWHTDGYYNPLHRPVRGLVLYTVQDAAEGGENALLDHELAYIALRDADPGHIAALSQPDAMTIPPNAEPGQPPRPAQPGPVFSVDPLTGALHMRYTARVRHVVWKDDPAVTAAVAALNGLLNGGCPWVLRHRMAPGQGLLCNNVLHNRTGFRDAPDRTRLVYRARFHDRVSAA